MRKGYVFVKKLVKDLKDFSEIIFILFTLRFSTLSLNQNFKSLFSCTFDSSIFVRKIDLFAGFVSHLRGKSSRSVLVNTRNHNKINDEGRYKNNNTFIDLRQFLVDFIKFAKGSLIGACKFLVDFIKFVEDIFNLFIKRKNSFDQKFQTIMSIK